MAKIDSSSRGTTPKEIFFLRKCLPAHSFSLNSFHKLLPTFRHGAWRLLDGVNSGQRGTTPKEEYLFRKCLSVHFFLNSFHSCGRPFAKAENKLSPRGPTTAGTPGQIPMNFAPELGFRLLDALFGECTGLHLRACVSEGFRRMVPCVAGMRRLSAELRNRQINSG